MPKASDRSAVVLSYGDAAECIRAIRGHLCNMERDYPATCKAIEHELVTAQALIDRAAKLTRDKP